MGFSQIITIWQCFAICVLCLSFTSHSIQASPIADLASANNRFAIKLYRELLSASDGNVVVSPYSLSTVLSMAYAGARGETAEQMADVLETTALGDQVHPIHHALAESLRITCNADTVARLSIANATWSAGCALNSSYSDLVARDYEAETRMLKADPVENARMINEWAAEHTEQKIKQVVTPDMLDTQLAMIITNAVYFLGRWQFPFDAEDTHSKLFWLTSNEQAEVKMMEQDLPAGSVKLLETDEFQAIELPYEESTAALDIFLSRRKDGLMALESKVNPDWLERQLNDMKPAQLEVDFSLPKVKTQGKASMSDVLKSLGMPLAFLPYRADFSGICGNPGDVYIDDVVHATFLEIDERGTEAAAVTAIMMGITSVPIQREKISFNVDHPFFFLIRDTATNTILFMGRITDPRS